MEKFDKKSIFLGIGVGIVMTSLVSMIYFSGVNDVQNKNVESVSTKDNNFEDVFKSSTSDFKISENNDNSGKDKAVNTNKDNANKDKTALKPTNTVVTSTPIKASPSPVVSATATPKAEENPYIYLSVNPGDSPGTIGNRLTNLGIIGKSETFVSEISNMGLDGSLEVGNFKIKKTMSLKEIIQIITTSKR